MVVRAETMLKTVAKELHLSEEDLLKQGLRTFLERQLREVKAKSSKSPAATGFQALRKWKHAIGIAPLRKRIPGETCSPWTTWNTSGIAFLSSLRPSHEFGGRRKAARDR